MFRRFARELSVALVYALLLLLLTTTPFYQGDKPRAIAIDAAPVLVLAVGMTLVILARQIDISVGSQFSVCAVVAGLMARTGMPMPVVVVSCVLVGAALGSINGLLIAGLGLPSIVVTLASLVILREGLTWARQGEFVGNLPVEWQWFGLGQTVGQWLIVGVALFVFVVFAWSLRNLGVGRAIYATGSDAEAARLAGIQPRLVVFAVFLLMGALSGLAAVLGAVRFAEVQPSDGVGLELKVIAAVVVGGVAVSGGRGTLVGPLLGVMLLATIGSALQFFHIEAHWEKAIQGAIILLAVASDALNTKRS